MQLYKVQCTIDPKDKKDTRDWYTATHYVIANIPNQAKIMVKNRYKESADTCLIDFVEQVYMDIATIII